MSQEEIYNFLKKAKKPMNLREISLHLKLGRTAISSNLRRLLRWGDIKFIQKRTKNTKNILSKFFYVK